MRSDCNIATGEQYASYRQWLVPKVRRGKTQTRCHEHAFTEEPFTRWGTWLGEPLLILEGTYETLT